MPDPLGYRSGGGMDRIKGEPGRPAPLAKTLRYAVGDARALSVLWSRIRTAAIRVPRTDSTRIE